MDLNEQEKAQNLPAASGDVFAAHNPDTTLSPLAKDLTYGERKYDQIFNFWLNFVTNLVVSAGFTTWLSHARTPVKIPFIKKELVPYMVQKSWAEHINKLPIMGLFGDKRMSVSKTMAGIFSLTTAGHFVMIPSVWLGSKFKSHLVEKWDRQHYGDEAMDDPSLKMRHAMVAAEERPTLFGAVLGRIGTVFATQATGYTVGNASNIFSVFGRKFNIGGLNKFPGLDYFTELMGSKVGSVATEALPGPTKKINDRFRGKGYGWSNIQLDTHPELHGVAYGTTLPNGIGGGIPEHFGRNLVADVLYTFVTASTISPAINFLKKYIPGITYKPKVSAEYQQILAEAPAYRPRPVRPFTIRDAVITQEIEAAGQANDNRASSNDNQTTRAVPQIQISGVTDHAKLASAEKHVAVAG